jgi:hypothetical protein
MAPHGTALTTPGPLFGGMPSGSTLSLAPAEAQFVAQALSASRVIGASTTPVAIPSHTWTYNLQGAVLPYSGLSNMSYDTFLQDRSPKWKDIQAHNGTEWGETVQRFETAAFMTKSLVINLLENLIKFAHGAVPAGEFLVYADRVLREMHRLGMNAIHFQPLMASTADPTLAALMKANHKELKQLAPMVKFPQGFLPAKEKEHATIKRTSGGMAERTHDPNSLCVMHQNSFHTNAKCEAQAQAKRKKADAPATPTTAAKS